MISAAASPAATSVLRHLRSLGHVVIGMDAAADAEYLGREFCDEFHVAPLASSPEYLEFLSVRLAEVDIFMPFIDEELIAIAEGWERIAADLAGRIAVSAPQVLLECTDKCKFQRACADAGLPIAPAVLEAPAFFKPRIGRGGRGVVPLTEKRMFDAMQGRDGVVQRMILGEEFTVDAIYDRGGSLVATSPRRRIRSAGVSTIGEVLPDRALHILAARLGERWQFRYAINFQVIRDGAGFDWIIELNPRLSGSGIFSAMAGCDPFAATIALWQGEPWSGEPRRLRIWRYWQEIAQEASP
jgi:carbamoyl-phosphate synthase large subunit